MGKFRTRIKQAFDEKSPNSLVLRFTCKASFGSFSSTLVLFCTVCVFCKLLAFREIEKNCRVETQLGVSNPRDIFFRKRKSLDLSKYRWPFRLRSMTNNILPVAVYISTTLNDRIKFDYKAKPIRLVSVVLLVTNRSPAGC